MRIVGFAAALAAPVDPVVTILVKFVDAAVVVNAVGCFGGGGASCDNRTSTVSISFLYLMIILKSFRQKTKKLQTEI